MQENGVCKEYNIFYMLSIVERKVKYLLRNLWHIMCVSLNIILNFWWGIYQNNNFKILSINGISAKVTELINS